MKASGTAIIYLLILIGLGPSFGAPIQDGDVGTDSSWSAHLDFERLGDAPLDGFLVQVAGFDRILQLRAIFKEKLGVDWELVNGVTLSGAGVRSGEAAMVLRGDFGRVDLTSLPLNEELPIHQGTSLRTGPDWLKKPLILATYSDTEWVAGTSLEAVKDSLDLLAGLKRPGSSNGLDDQVTHELKSSAAMFALDMKKLNGELQFEADFTRAIQRAWFLIGSRKEEVEATLMIESTDREGLVFLQKQLQILSAVLNSQSDSPSIWLELTKAIEIETRGNWLTVKVAASPEKSAAFLKSLGPLFVKTTEPATE